MPNRIKNHAFQSAEGQSTFADDVHHGLSRPEKFLTPKYFYDALGSHLFEAICYLDEYYLTRAEEKILDEEIDKILACFEGQHNLVELGSGSSVKTRHLLEAFVKRQGSLHYLPIDISTSVLERSANELVQLFPGLRVTTVASDYKTALSALGERGAHRAGADHVTVLFLGSSIGNLDRDGACELLRNIRGILEPGDHLLLGADLKKSTEILLPAYDDPWGVTAAFNLNILRRINRELGGDFDPRRFRHDVIYDTEHGRIEMRLRSTEAQTVRIPDLGLEISFAEGELLRTEHSHKYDHAVLTSMAEDCGFVLAQQWTDAEDLFSVNLLEVD